MPNSQPNNKTAPPPGRLRLFERRVHLIGGAVILVAIVAVSIAIARRPVTSPIIRTANQNSGLTNVPSSTLYSDLFQVMYRADQGIGNVAVAAVYESPALQQALLDYSQKSAHQQEVAATLARLRANQDTLVFYLIIDSVVAQSTLDLSQGLLLTDSQDERYPFRSWEKLTTFLPQEEGQVRTASLLVFDRTSENGRVFSAEQAGTLQLTIANLADALEREFRWDLRALP